MAYPLRMQCFMQLEGVTARPRSCRLASLLTPGTAALIIATASLPAAPAAAAVVVHPADEVLSDWTVRSGDALYFQAPNGRLWKLVTDIDDPVIHNKGQGAFFPVNPAHVKTALEAITYPLENTAGHVFILPYPRAELLPSSTEGDAIVLSPGVAPLSELHVHALVAHEMGHVVHRAFLPDLDRDGWAAYRRLRGIEDTRIYNAAAAHRDRPHEIFAEDFRALFGGTAANYAGSIENTTLTMPGEVDGLETFFLALAENGTATTLTARLPLPLYPNPTRAGATLALAGSGDGTPLTLTVFDVTGRLVARRTMTGNYRWDGRDDEGTPVSRGLYLLRATRGARTWVGKLLVQH